ncbi:MAG: protein jag [Lachnospiraceae bacterium]|nr:protein jag [Lachnospiraceae bacterium]
MVEWKEFSGKTIEEAVSAACEELTITSDKLVYEVVEKETSGLLGLFSKPAVIKVKLEKNDEEKVRDFLNEVFAAMRISVNIDIKTDPIENVINIDLSGDEMGILIGKRGGTLDSLQYLVSLYVNKNREDYVKIKIDSENYRERRKATLENLAKNLASKVKRTRKPAHLEPMNPYERRIIHFALQQDEYVETHSEGEEPYRNVVISLKPGVKLEDTYRRGYNKRGRSYGNRNGGHKNGGYKRSNYNKNKGYNKYDKSKSANASDAAAKPADNSAE